MKRCSLPDAQQLVIMFGDLLADEPDPWAEADVDILAAIQEALDGQPPLFLVVQNDDGLSPHCDDSASYADGFSGHGMSTLYR
jgi:hypothetical protein